MRSPSRSKSRPIILLTNDDGISAAGLQDLAKALAPVGDVWVVAPDRERTAGGHGVTLHKPLRVVTIRSQWCSVNGTPADCVSLAVLQLLPKNPALLVSGMNRGVNVGDDVIYSGTVAGAREGMMLGVPSLAVSLEGSTRLSGHEAGKVVRRLVQTVLRSGLPPETFLNVNVPDVAPGRISGTRVTRLSRRRFDDPIIEKIDPHGRPYYWIAGTRVTWKRDPDSDVVALQNRYISVTPLHVDATQESALPALRDRLDSTGMRRASKQAGKARRPGSRAVSRSTR
ncbi:MAG: 5'/3'-nucleotidase SurE [Nitrospiraceae bacterium]